MLQFYGVNLMNSEHLNVIKNGTFKTPPISPPPLPFYHPHCHLHGCTNPPVYMIIKVVA